jgi:hypothetical protein
VARSPTPNSPHSPTSSSLKTGATTTRPQKGSNSLSTSAGMSSMGDAAVDVGTVQKGWRTRHTGMVVASALVLCVALPSMLAMEGTRVHANGTGLSSKSIEVSGAKSTAAAAAHTRLAAKVVPFVSHPGSPPLPPSPHTVIPF